jgi:hypothetical protein
MKTNFLIWTGLFLSVIVSGCSTSKGLTKEDKTAMEAALQEAIENRMFVVEVTRALPMGGGSRALTTSYSLEVNNEEVKSYLPYFGRAYSVPYGGGEGLIFNSVITDYQSSTDKKGTVIIEFNTKSKEDRLVYRVRITPSGVSIIDVTSINRQPISFHGRAYPKKGEENN